MKNYQNNVDCPKFIKVFPTLVKSTLCNDIQKLNVLFPKLVQFSEANVESNEILVQLSSVIGCNIPSVTVQFVLVNINGLTGGNNVIFGLVFEPLIVEFKQL